MDNAFFEALNSLGSENGLDTDTPHRKGEICNAEGSPQGLSGQRRPHYR